MKTYVRSILIIFVAVASITGCSPAVGSTKTPVPQPTWPSPPASYPIKNSQDAVNVARGLADTGHFRLIGDVKTVSVQEMNLADANQVLSPERGFSNEDRPGETKVWLVQFYSQTEVQPPPGPDGKASPTLNIGYGCTYVMFQAADGGRATVAGAKCPKNFPPIPHY